VTTLVAPTRLDYRVPASRITASFLKALVERRFVGRPCPACRSVYVPPRALCPTCAVPLGAEVDVGPGGVVTAFSIVRLAFEGQLLEPPYACAHVLLVGADVPLLHLVGGCPPETVHNGLRVAPVWGDPAPTLLSLRFFRP
jgi:uncharacterized OB-fold protein